MERVEHLLRLALTPGVGCVTVNRLLAQFGSADKILGASEDAIKAVEGVRANHARAVLAARDIDPRPELDLAAAHDVNVIAYDDPQYPKALRQTYDPPFVLYIRGEIKPADGVAMAIVGTRRPSHYGREQAERFGGLLARGGFCVVSGLARGVDSFAHKGALGAGGRTLAVLGSGLAELYPPENRDLAAEIARQGAVISEFPMETKPARDTFPRRNRIIAGLSMGVLIAEAPLRSGALITARHANEMGREVFAIPGRVDQENAAGCHRLIRDGATLVRNLEDILEEIGPVPDDLIPKPAAAPTATSSSADESPPTAQARAVQAKENKILAALSAEPLHIDQVCAATGLPVHEVSATLMILEIKRQVRQQPGKFFVKSTRQEIPS